MIDIIFMTLVSARAQRLPWLAAADYTPIYTIFGAFGLRKNYKRCLFYADTSFPAFDSPAF